MSLQIHVNITWNAQLVSSQQKAATSFLVQPTEQHLLDNRLGTSLFFRKCLTKRMFFNSERLLFSASLCIWRPFSWNSSKLRFISFNEACCSSFNNVLLSVCVVFSSCWEVGMNFILIFKGSAFLVMENGMISKLKKEGRRKNTHVNGHQGN